MNEIYASKTARVINNGGLFGRRLCFPDNISMSFSANHFRGMSYSSKHEQLLDERIQQAAFYYLLPSQRIYSHLLRRVRGCILMVVPVYNERLLCIFRLEPGIP